MARIRVSTTVDERLLTAARRVSTAANDAALLDAALGALLEQARAVEFDAGYAAYETIPLDTPDEWGDLESFRDKAAAS